MTDQTSQQPNEIDALITAAVNASFDCGEWDDDEHHETYLPLAEKARIASEKLRAAVAALKQAVESERDKVLEEAAQMADYEYHMDKEYDAEDRAVIENVNVALRNCAKAIRELKSQQPAQADKPDIESIHAARAIAAYEASGATTPWMYLDPAEWSKWEKIADAVHALERISHE